MSLSSSLTSSLTSSFPWRGGDTSLYCIIGDALNGSQLTQARSVVCADHGTKDSYCATVPSGYSQTVRRDVRCKYVVIAYTSRAVQCSAR